MNDTCVFAVIFPSNLPFFERFLLSLENQDFKKFDVLLLNDGVLEDDLQVFLQQKELTFTVKSAKGTISEIRNQGINLLNKSPYKYIVFADTDDYFSLNRIRVSWEYLQNFDLVINDLSLFQENNNQIEAFQQLYLSNRLVNEQAVTLKNITKGNFIGLGNAAVRKEFLNGISLPTDLEIVDWFLFATVLACGATAVFTNQAVTFYRQHTLNTTGLKELSKEELLGKIKQKQKLYSYLQNISKDYYAYHRKADRLLEYLNKDPQNLNWYYSRLSDLKPVYPFWWETILMLDEI